MHSSQQFALVLAIVLGGSIGCATRPDAARNPIGIASGEYSRLFRASIVVLRDEGFVVDRKDYRFGIVTAKPAASPTLFEPWHDDNATSDQTIASTITPQRRQITITFEPTAEKEPGSMTTNGSDPYTMRTEVMIERFAMPTARTTGSTGPGRLIDPLSALPTEWRQRGIQAAYWQPVERDPYFENRLMEQIVRRSIQISEDQVTVQ